MLPFSIILLLLPLIRAQEGRPQPTKTKVVKGIFPPYQGDGYFYASVIGVGTQGTTFAMTCLGPSSWPTPDPESRDACGTSSLGTGSQTFVQGDDTWFVDRPKTSGEEFWTSCSLIASASITPTEGPYDPKELDCSARVSGEGTIFDEAGLGSGRFGLRNRRVTVTAGFDKIGVKGEMVTTPPTEPTYSFTDIGKSDTREGPVVTVTLLKTNPGGVGSPSKSMNLGILLVTLFVSSVCVVL